MQYSVYGTGGGLDELIGRDSMGNDWFLKAGRLSVWGKKDINKFCGAINGFTSEREQITGQQPWWVTHNQKIKERQNAKN